MTALITILGFLAQGTGQPPEAPAPLAAPHPVLIHDDPKLLTRSLNESCLSVYNETSNSTGAGKLCNVHLRIDVWRGLRLYLSEVFFKGSSGNLNPAN
jgi:hypothetical protein